MSSPTTNYNMVTLRVNNIHNRPCNLSEMGDASYKPLFKHFVRTVRRLDVPAMYAKADAARRTHKPLPALPRTENNTSSLNIKVPENAYGTTMATTGLTERQERALYLLREVFLPQIANKQVEGLCNHTLVAIMEVIDEFGVMADSSNDNGDNGDKNKVVEEKKSEYGREEGSGAVRQSRTALLGRLGKGKEKEMKWEGKGDGKWKGMKKKVGGLKDKMK